MFDQGGGIGAMFREKGNADAGRDKQFLAFDGVRGFQTAQQLGGHLRCIIILG